MQRRTLILFILLAFALAACSGAATDSHMAEAGEHAAMDSQMAEADDHAADNHAADEHSAAGHGIPEEAAAMPNPVPMSDASMAAGQATYTQYCAVCHGPEGKGDGPGAAALEPKPANFSEAHVQELSDGALFHVITHGREGTAMVAWENIIGEEQRWEVVNYLRTFGGGHGH